MSFRSFISASKEAILLKLRARYNKSKRFRLKNSNPTIITRNCMAGIIYHDLGLRFNSPTVNLSMDNEDFIVFLENFNAFLEEDPIPSAEHKNGYPEGELKLKSKSVHINFVHYKTFEEALSKWKQRIKRIDPDNMYIIWEVSNEYGPDIGLYKRFCDLPFKNKILITGKKFPESAKNIVKMGIYNSKYHYGKILEYCSFPFSYKRYLNRFDYVKFLNSK